MRKEDFTLFWSITPAVTDWANLTASRVRRVMVPYALAVAKPDTLARLSGLGCHLIVRLEDDNQIAAAEVVQALDGVRHIIPVDAVIVGNEPDGGCNMHYGSPDWCQKKAYSSYVRSSYLIDAIKGIGLRSVSPPMSHPPEAISEDGPPLPGRVTFREIVAPSYQSGDGCGLHIYALGWSSVVDELRFKFALRAGVANWHKPVWIDEVGVIMDSNVRQMQAYTAMADIVMKHPAGERVEMFCPFVSTGIPGGQWDSRFLLKDPACYAELGRWMAA